MDLSKVFEGDVHPSIVRFAQYCVDLAGDAEMPRRSLFRPSRVSSIITYLFLIDVLYEEHDYYFSLFGSRMTVLYGEDLTRRRLGQVGDANLRHFLHKTYDQVVESRKPLYLRGRYVWPDMSVAIERLLVPMADDAGNLSTILGVAIPDCPADTLLVFAGQGAAQLVVDHETAVD